MVCYRSKPIRERAPCAPYPLTGPTRVKGTRGMSDKHPECPLCNPLNCKEYHNPKVCAFAPRDKACLKRKRPKAKLATRA